MKIEDLAVLARLHLSEEEKDLFSGQLGSVIEYIHTLNELNTADIEPTAHVLPIKNVFREDRLRPSLSPEEVLRNAPEKRDHFFSVPKIIE